MSHEFLTSLHSHVIGGVGEKMEVKPAQKSAGRPARDKPARKNAVAEDERHRTMGVSMSPQLRARAAARAREVGLSFSRYVQWCVEAELDGSTIQARFRPPTG